MFQFPWWFYWGWLYFKGRKLFTFLELGDLESLPGELVAFLGVSVMMMCRKQQTLALFAYLPRSKNICLECFHQKKLLKVLKKINRTVLHAGIQFEIIDLFNYTFCKLIQKINCWNLCWKYFNISAFWSRMNYYRIILGTQVQSLNVLLHPKINLKCLRRKRWWAM